MPASSASPESFKSNVVFEGIKAALEQVCVKFTSVLADNLHILKFKIINC